MTTSTIKNLSNCAKCSICQCRCCKNKRTKCSRVKKAHLQSDIQFKNSKRHCLLILVRHGLSQDEVDKRFSGWTDCDLSNIGKEQMYRTGQILHQASFSIDICFTSILKRASKSLFIIQEEMDYLWLPVINTWRLNDRMLGSLTGFHHDRAESLFGQNQIKEWLTRPDSAPPLLEESSALHPRLNYKYHYISSIVPSTETLSDIRKRLLPFFYDQLLPNIYLGKNVILVTHEEVLKAIIRLLNNYAVDDYNHQEIPIGMPIVFEFSLNTNEFFNGYYLSSASFENYTNNQFQLYPLGYSTETIKSLKDIIQLNSTSSSEKLIFYDKSVSSQIIHNVNDSSENIYTNITAHSQPHLI